VREDRPPLSFRDGEGRIGGYTIDLCQAVVQGVRETLENPTLSVTFVPVTAENRFDKLEAGEIDILCGATTKTLARQKRMDFTDPTFVTGATLMSPGDTPVPNLKALGGKTVAVVSNTTTIEVVEALVKQANIDATVLPVEDSKAGLEALNSGKADAYAADQVVLIGLALTAPSGQRYAISNSLFSFEPFALAIQRGDPDFRLVANTALARLYRSGRVRAVYDHWFKSFAENPPDLLRALFVLGATPE